MKRLLIITILLTSVAVHSQTADREANMKETISWINKQFREHADNISYAFKDVVLVNEEPILYVVTSPGLCGENDEIEQIPLKKIMPVSYQEMLSPEHSYAMVIKTKNGEEIVWYQNEERNCGQIGDHALLFLKDSIEEEDIKNRLVKAFSYLMSLYGNTGKEKF